MEGIYALDIFQDDEFKLQAVEPAASVTEVCDSGLTFGGSSGSCQEEVEVVEAEETDDECDGLTFGGGSC